MQRLMPFWMSCLVYRQSHRLKREIPPQRAVKFSLNHRSPMRLNLNPNRS
uniref:Uncharacterized protein n=1 Tax=Escherichia coli TaxID=562 RepID=Q9EVQ6_ECOLX|nr:hypothetical protein [Escherichia coli]